MNIPILDLKLQYLAHRKEVDEAILGVLETGQFVLGPNVSEGCTFRIGIR